VRYWTSLIHSAISLVRVRFKQNTLSNMLYYVFVKVKLSVFTPWRRTGGAKVYLHSFLAPSLGGVELSVSCPGHITSRERMPATHWIGGHVAVLDVLEKRILSCPNLAPNPWRREYSLVPTWRQTHGCPDHSPLTVLYQLSWCSCVVFRYWTKWMPFILVFCSLCLLLLKHLLSCEGVVLFWK
jgi:hypothetical protein